MENQRYITLSDGTSMGGELIIFKTNAPMELLKELETISCKAYEDKKEEDVPIWANVVQEKGFEFEYIASHQHITPFQSSSEWIENHPIGAKINEHYVIDDQPEFN